MVLQPHGCIATIVVWALPRSLATTRGIIVYFLFLEVLRCFSSLRLLSTLWQSGSLTAVGLSHSDICGSKIICIYPQLFAAYHVLHRLCEPRHPPCALYYFLAARCLLTCHHNMKPAVTEDVSLLSFFIYSLVLSCANMSKISLHYIRNRFQQYEKPGGRTGRTMLHLTLVTGISS